MGELIDLGVKANVVEKSGSWYSYGPQHIGQGKENTRKFMKTLILRWRLKKKSARCRAYRC